MTLCIAWRDQESVHFLSDSRLTTAANSYADVAIKVLPLPVRLFAPTEEDGSKPLAHEFELAMCFAGSAVNSLFLKETIGELLKSLQFAPDHSDVSMNGIADFVFNGYRQLSKEICSTSIAGNGVAQILIAGHCPANNRLRVFSLETDTDNQHSCVEVLKAVDEYKLIGSGASKARQLLPVAPGKDDFIDVLLKVIEDMSVPGVGGPVQYGTFEAKRFRCAGVAEFEDGSDPKYLWGGLNLNSASFINAPGGFVPGITFVGPIFRK